MTRLSYEHDGDGWRAHHPTLGTLYFPRAGGVFLYASRDVPHQLEGALDFCAGRDTPRDKRRVGIYARWHFRLLEEQRDAWRVAQEIDAAMTAHAAEVAQ